MRKVIMVCCLLLPAMVIWADEMFDVSLMMFSVTSRSNEDVAFLEKKVPEILKNLLGRNDSENFSFSLAWESSKKYDDWKARSDISAYENGKIVNADFVIYGDLEDTASGYRITLYLLNVHTNRVVASINKSAAESRDVYSFLDSISTEVFGIIKTEINRYLANRITPGKLLSVTGSLGYPLPANSYLGIEIGAFYLGARARIEKKWLVRENISLGIAGSAGLSFAYLINNPQKITGSFFDIALHLEVYFLVSLWNKCVLLFGTGFTNYFSVYSQKGFDGKYRGYFSYGPAIPVLFNFEFPLGKNKKISLGMENAFHFIFYQGSTAGSVMPKFEYRPGIYFRYRPEV